MDIENVVLGSLLIFVVRVISIALSTVRVLIMGRSNRLIVAVIAFIEALTFALTFGVVASNLSNVWYLVSYSGGFAAGTWVGTSIEEWLGQGYQTIHIVSVSNSLQIAKKIRDAGFGATRTSGEGTTGTVGMIFVVARRKNVPQIVKVVTDIDPKAFVTIGEARSVARGYLGYGRS